MNGCKRGLLLPESLDPPTIVLMSTPTIWLDAIWDSELPVYSKVIAAFLRKHLHGNKYNCYPSIGRIMKGCSLGKSSVHKYLNVLIEKGWLARESGFKGRSNNYVILFENIESPQSEQDSSPDRLDGCATQTLKTNTRTNMKNNKKEDILTRHFDNSWSDGIETADDD